MKDTPELREWINETVHKYYKQIGVNKIPKTVFNLEECPHEIKCDHIAKQYKKFAAVNFISKGEKPHYLLFNLPYHRTFREFENTIAHEMLHIRFPHMEHGEEYEPGEDFFTRLGMVLMGKHYPKAVKKAKAKPKK